MYPDTHNAGGHRREFGTRDNMLNNKEIQAEREIELPLNICCLWQSQSLCSTCTVEPIYKQNLSETYISYLNLSYQRQPASRDKF